MRRQAPWRGERYLAGLGPQLTSDPLDLIETDVSMKLRSVFLASTLLLTSVSLAAAQARWPVFLETTAGKGGGSTEGEYRNNSSGITADALLGFRPSPNFRSGVVFAAAISMHGSGPVTAICIPASNGGCVPAFPDFLTIAGLIGYERGVNSTVRFSAGPAYASAGDRSSIAFQGRIDAALPVLWHLSIVASGRAVLIPDYRGDSFTLRSVGIGLRLR